MKRFLAVKKKRIIPFLIPPVLILTLLYCWGLNRNQGTLEFPSNTFVPPQNTSKQTEKKTQEEDKVLMTYQPISKKDPFRPLVDLNTLNSDNKPVPENIENFPPSEPSPLPNDTSSNLPEEKKSNKPILKGIMEDKKGFSALLSLGAKSQIIQVGDYLEGFGQVVSITRGQVLLKEGQEKIILEIGKD